MADRLAALEIAYLGAVESACNLAGVHAYMDESKEAERELKEAREALAAAYTEEAQAADMASALRQVAGKI